VPQDEIDLAIESRGRKEAKTLATRSHHRTLGSVLEDEVDRATFPSQLRYEAMILVPIIPIVGENESGENSRFSDSNSSFTAAPAYGRKPSR